jgi:hypothetical protein
VSRIAYVSGRLGAGKSSLAAPLAAELGHRYVNGPLMSALSVIAAAKLIPRQMCAKMAGFGRHPMVRIVCSRCYSAFSSRNSRTRRAESLRVDLTILIPQNDPVDAAFDLAGTVGRVRPLSTAW